MRWRTKESVEKDREAAGWRTWFAWHPVVIEGRWVWLERVERSRCIPLVFRISGDGTMVPDYYEARWRWRDRVLQAPADREKE